MVKVWKLWVSKVLLVVKWHMSSILLSPVQFLSLFKTRSCCIKLFTLLNTVLLHKTFYPFKLWFATQVFSQWYYSQSSFSKWWKKSLMGFIYRFLWILKAVWVILSQTIISFWEFCKKHKFLGYPWEFYHRFMYIAPFSDYLFANPHTVL